jgi:hypothetical protein
MPVGFSVRLMPSVRINASTRGIRLRFGPRAARVNLGSGGMSFSSGMPGHVRQRFDTWGPSWDRTLGSAAERRIRRCELFHRLRPLLRLYENQPRTFAGGVQRTLRRTSGRCVAQRALEIADVAGCGT